MELVKEGTASAGTAPTARALVIYLCVFLLFGMARANDKYGYLDPDLLDVILGFGLLSGAAVAFLVSRIGTTSQRFKEMTARYALAWGPLLIAIAIPRTVGGGSDERLLKAVTFSALVLTEGLAVAAARSSRERLVDMAGWETKRFWGRRATKRAKGE